MRLAAPAPTRTASAAAREASSLRASRAVVDASAPATASQIQPRTTSAATSSAHSAATDHDAFTATATAAAIAPPAPPTITRRAASPGRLLATSVMRSICGWFPAPAHTRERSEGGSLRLASFAAGPDGGDMDENVILVTFQDESLPFEALASVRQLDATQQIVLRDAAVVSRSDTGQLSLRDETDDDDAPGTVTGGIVGLIVGILGGPIGVLFGGAVGLMAGSLYDLAGEEDTDSDLEHIARDIPNGTTALIAALGEYGRAPLDDAMRALDGSVSRYARADVEAELAAADRAARKARRTARKEMLRGRRKTARDKIHAKLEQMSEKLRAAREKLVHH